MQPYQSASCATPAPARHQYTGRAAPPSESAPHCTHRPQSLRPGVALWVALPPQHRALPDRQIPTPPGSSGSLACRRALAQPTQRDAGGAPCSHGTGPHKRVQKQLRRAACRSPAARAALGAGWPLIDVVELEGAPHLAARRTLAISGVRSRGGEACTWGSEGTHEGRHAGLAVPRAGQRCSVAHRPKSALDAASRRSACAACQPPQRCKQLLCGQPPSCPLPNVSLDPWAVSVRRGCTADLRRAEKAPRPFGPESARSTRPAPRCHR